MATFITSDLHLGHKLCAIMRGFFNENALVKQFIDDNSHLPHNELYRLTTNKVRDMIQNFEISYDEVKERIFNMNETIISNFNSKVGDRDTVYMLGDICFTKTKEEFLSLISRFNGARLILIKGNHDDKIVTSSDVWYGVHERYTLKENNMSFVLDHYPLATWNKAHYGSYNIHGHCHGSYPISTQQMDAGIDTNDLFPYLLSECVDKMSKSPKFIIPDYHGGGDLRDK